MWILSLLSDSAFDLVSFREDESFGFFKEQIAKIGLFWRTSSLRSSSWILYVGAWSLQWLGVARCDGKNRWMICKWLLNIYRSTSYWIVFKETWRQSLECHDKAIEWMRDLQRLLDSPYSDAKVSRDVSTHKSISKREWLLWLNANRIDTTAIPT